jgi:hypothetical protein
MATEHLQFPFPLPNHCVFFGCKLNERKFPSRVPERIGLEEGLWRAAGPGVRTARRYGGRACSRQSRLGTIAVDDEPIGDCSSRSRTIGGLNPHAGCDISGWINVVVSSSKRRWSCGCARLHDCRATALLANCGRALLTDRSVTSLAQGGRWRLANGGCRRAECRPGLARRTLSECGPGLTQRTLSERCRGRSWGVGAGVIYGASICARAGIGRGVSVLSHRRVHIGNESQGTQANKLREEKSCFLESVLQLN